MNLNKSLMLGALTDPTRHLFFTGKGGVGKTTLACAVALALADQGKKVLIVSTDPASNLDEMLGVELTDKPKPVTGATNLFAMNIDPEIAANDYRARVLDQMDHTATATERATVREQLSGSCTTEIASFDEFVSLLTTAKGTYDHIVFDTAPTGHTLRLLSLPKAWTGFLKDNDRGASCLGPHSGLKMQESRFRVAMSNLSDPSQTTIVLVARPDKNTLKEAARTSHELQMLGLGNQRLMINGMFIASDRSDGVALSIEALGKNALAELPEGLRSLPQDRIPLRIFDMVGLGALRQVLSVAPAVAQVSASAKEIAAPNLPGLSQLVDELSAAGSGLIMVMGKGGVGKTTIAAALAVGLVQRGYSVHLSTTDPAAHVIATLGENMAGLTVDRIDPKVETQRYIEKIMTARAKDLDEGALALLQEDLQSPCTEEVAVFHAFSHIVAEARSHFVVLDTAPTGHTLLLMDATGAYHRQMTKNVMPEKQGRIITPLMRLQDADYSKIILVALPETTPVSEAATLQEDLRRAKIEPFAWVINRSLLGTETRDPILAARLPGEQTQINRVLSGLSKHVFLLPWQSNPPVGIAALTDLVVASGKPL